MAASETDADRLFARLQEEGINVFYVKAAVEFGKIGDLCDAQGQGR
jgi:hypothetical protein